MLVTHGADLHPLLPFPVALAEELHHDAVSPLPVQLQRLRGVAEVGAVHHVLQDLRTQPRHRLPKVLCPPGPPPLCQEPPWPWPTGAGRGGDTKQDMPAAPARVRTNACNVRKLSPPASSRPPGSGQSSCPAAAPPGWSPSWSPPWFSNPPADSCAWTCPWPAPGQGKPGMGLSLTPPQNPSAQTPHPGVIQAPPHTMSITILRRDCLCFLLRFWKMSQFSSWRSLKPTAR